MVFQSRGIFCDGTSRASVRDSWGLAMSVFLCVPICAAPVFQQLCEGSGQSFFALPRLLQDYVACVYLWRAKETDGVASMYNKDREGALRNRGQVQRAKNRTYKRRPLFTSHAERTQRFWTNPAPIELLNFASTPSQFFTCQELLRNSFGIVSQNVNVLA
eukprot:gb/GEZJ01001071.1/.p1 GENE.gb/GEZJ01001071.1/~~gb/GEZJ01001071.1/.p1  ORF type:complete len:160 (+),score=1.38 gb/GEZJ01001071.1/:591-1070(+)